MFLIKTLILISLLFTFVFAKGEVSKIFAHKENAISSGYTGSDGKGYKWGQGTNIVIDGFEYNGTRYNYISQSPIIKIRRSDNNNSSGEPCGLFAQKKDNDYNLAPTFPTGCDMAKVMGGRIINIGALDLFKNKQDSYDTPKNIERVDFISPEGIIAPSNINELNRAGHVVTEKSGNNEIQIAAILSLDSNGDPASFGPLVTVHDENQDALREVEYGDTYIYLDNNITIGSQYLGFYRNQKKSPQTPEPTLTGTSHEKMDMAFVSLKDLGITTNQKYYGFAYFGSDVNDNMNLVDYASFPKNTPMNSLNHTDTADPYGGVAGYFADETITPYEPFSCTSDSYLTSSYDFFSLDFIDKKAILLKKDYTTENINAIGYNVKDNLIWGWSRSSKKIVRIDSKYNIEKFDTSIPKLDFVAGDISIDGILYLSGYDDTNISHKTDNHTIYKVKIEHGVPKYLGSVPYSNQSIHFGDYAINPKDNHLYAIDSNSGHLFRLNPQTGVANDLGAVSGLINNQIYFHSYVFDSNGNLYFYSNLNNATVYKIDLSNVTQADINNPNFSATIFTNIAGMSATGDGARCANAQMPETEDNSSIPFTCNTDTYLFNGYPKSDAYTIDLLTGDYTLEKSGIDNRINATGYNVKDNFIWGYDIDKNLVIRIDANYTVKEYNVSNLPNKSFYAGDVSLDGILYLHTHTQQGSDKLYKVNLNHATPQYDGFITLNKTVSFGDFAFNPIDNMLYSIDEIDKNLYKIDISNGDVDTLKNIDINDTINFHTYVFDRDGNLYFYGTSGKIYKIYIGDGNSNSYNVELFSATDIKKAGGDGTRCANASMPSNDTNSSGICYGLIDNGKKVYEMDLSHNISNRIINIDKKFVGEGTAYRSINHTLYAFQTYKNGSIDKHGDTSSLFSIDLSSTANIVKTIKVKDNIVPNEVEGAEFYYDPILKKEILYILTSKDEKKDTIKLHAFYADEWDNEISGYPKNVDGVRLGSLAIDPKTGQGYATDDAGPSTPAEVYKLNLKTGIATFLFKAKKRFDSEGLAFAKDGNLYTEDDGYYSNLKRKIYKIDLLNNKYIPVRKLSGTKDIEGLSCNGIAYSMPTNLLELSITNVSKPEGDSGTTDFDFIIFLNKPAPKGGITIDYSTKDGTAGDENFDDNETILPKISITDAIATEANSDGVIKFDVLLDKPAPLGGIMVEAIPENITAIEGSDYSKITSSIYIAQGQIRKELEYKVIADTTAESTETFKVKLSNPQNVIIDREYGIGTIYDDDNSSSNNSATNNSSGSFFNWWNVASSFLKEDGKSINKQAKKSNKTIYIDKSTQININKNSGTNNSSGTKNSPSSTTSPNIADYQKVQGTLTINEGEQNATIHVTVNGDNEVENDETFYVVTLPPVGVNSIMPIGTGTIVDDDNQTSKGTQGMILTRGDGNDDTKTNVYIFDVNLSNNSISNFHLVKKLNQKYRSLIYHDNKYITVGVDGTIYYIDPITGDAIEDNSYGKIDNKNIMAIDFDDNGDIIYQISTDSSKRKNIYKYSTDIGISSVIKTFSEELNGAISYWNENRYSTSFKSGGIKNINFDNSEDVPDSLDESNIYGGERISIDKAYFINSETNNLSIYLSDGKDWSSIYDYGSNPNGNTGGLKGEAIAILPIGGVKPLEKFECSEATLFVSNRTKSGDAGNDSGRTWLHSIDQNSTPYKLNYIGDGFLSSYGGYNALGYNPIDNFLYALYGTHLLKIDKNAQVIDLGIVSGLSTQLYAGAFDRDGYYYVSGDGNPSDKMYKIDISQKKVIDTITLKYNQNRTGDSIKFNDISIDQTNQYFYAMLIDSSNKNDKFVKIDKTTGVISVISNDIKKIDSEVETIFTDIDGDIFVLEHNNGFYKINSSNGYIYKISSTNELASYSDGANCVEANISEPSTISIESKVMEYEGDSGTKEFNFNIYFTKPAPADAGFWVTYTDGVNAISPMDTALHIDSHPDNGDFGGKARYIDIPQGTTHYEINATVYGDIEIEADEEFYVDIYEPNNLAISQGRGVGVILNDDHVLFNIERVDSDKIIPTNLDEQHQKEELYTQIAKRDFDYAIVSYDKNQSNFQEFPIEDVTLKIELIDINSSSNDVLYSAFKYLDNKDSRFKIIDNADLKVKATREAIYKISYLESNKTIVHGDFSNGDAFDNNSSVKSTYARDIFSIRPAGFKLSLWADDGTNRDNLATNNEQNPKNIALASGYDYELEVEAISDIGDIEQGYNTHYTNIYPTQEVNATLLFDGNKTHCNDTDNKNLKYYNFTQGINSNKLLSYDNVGNFIIKIKDENWTNIDHIFSSLPKGCIPNSATNQADADGKFGCNISTTFDISSSTNKNYHDMRVYFQPYSFDVNLTVTSNGHNDFLYMGDLTQNQNMAIKIDGTITAKEKNGKTTTNFTQNCLAHRVNLSLDYRATTSLGIFDNPPLDTIIIRNENKTAQNSQGEIISTQRAIKYNDNNYSMVTESNALDNNLTLEKEDFKDSKKGISNISIIYNIKKSLYSPINPVKLNFNKATVISKESISNLATNKIEDFFPTGEQILNKSIKLYYGAVIPDRENYPDSYTKSALTPVGVYIYCKHNRTFCDNNIGNNGLNNSKTQLGWYLSILHNSTTDGTINPTSANKVTITPKPIPNFNQGRKGRLDLKTNYTGGAIPENNPIDTEVLINPSPWLKYHKDPSRSGNPFWHNRFRSDKGTMTGIGATGGVVEIEANRIKTDKLDW